MSLFTPDHGPQRRTTQTRANAFAYLGGAFSSFSLWATAAWAVVLVGGPLSPSSSSAATPVSAAATPVASTAPAAPSTPTAAPDKSAHDWADFQKKVKPFFEENCVDCHSGDNAENGIHLDGFTSQADIDNHADVLAKAMLMLSSHKMPPAKQPQPKDEDRNAIVDWLHAFDDASIYAGQPNPGRVTIRRLNRAEYNNTIDDLLGIDFRPGDAFPADDAGYGFDNNGDVLVIAPVLMEKYLTAGTQALDRVISVDPNVKVAEVVLDPNALDGTVPRTVAVAATPPAGAAAPGAAAAAQRGGNRGGRANNGRVFPYTGDIHADNNFAKDGNYVFNFKAYYVAGTPPADAGAAAGGGGRGGNNNRAQVTIQIDSDPPSRRIVVDQALNNATDFQSPPIHVTAGRHRVTLAFVNGATPEEFKAAPPPPPPPAVPAGRRGGNNGGGGGPAPSTTGKPILGIQSFVIQGPVDHTPDRMPPNFARLFVSYPSPTVTKEQAAEKVIRHFANRAFRRPATDGEMKSLLAFWTGVDADQRPFEQSIGLTLQAILVSPQFLFRIEADPTPQEKGVHTLTEFELASRLSYFIWNSMPDDDLFRLANQGKLRENLDPQVRRMLQDPKAAAFVENFTGQWLELRQMENVNPNPDKFPDFDDSLRSAMVQETRLFFQEIMSKDLSVVDFIDANFTFVNDRLAKHYGIPGIEGSEFRRITLPSNQPRGGLLTQGSILTLTSYSNRTSPVLRGKWVLENLLNAAPPPPPADVPKLAENDKGEAKGTMRQRLEQHRSNPTCAGCHARMDPIGFGLENFDAIGAWHANDSEKNKIDASGVLPDGSTFVGAEGLRTVLVAQKDQFVGCLADRLLTFALGRGLERTDRRFVNDISKSVAQHDYKFSSLVAAIVISDPFQKRTAPSADSPAPSAPNKVAISTKPDDTPERHNL